MNCIEDKKVCDTSGSITSIQKGRSFDFATNLSRYEDVLEVICSYLDYRDLEQVRSIDSEWNYVATKQMKKRCKSTWFMLPTGSSETQTPSPYFSENYRKESAQLFIVAHKYSTFLRQMCFHNKCRCRKKRFSSCFIRDLIPAGTDYCILTCTDVITPETPGATEYLLHGLSVPKIEHVRIVPFYYRNDQAYQFDSIVRPDETIKCCLLFSTGHKHDIIESLLIRERMDENVAFGGGLIKCVHSYFDDSYETLMKHSDLFGVAFVGSKDSEPDFDSYSVVIAEYEDFVTSTTKFRDKCVKRQNGIVFAFRCYDKANETEEAKILYETFENYQILNTCVDGELGWNSYPGFVDANIESLQFSLRSSRSRKRAKTCPLYYHCYSTILVFITWGRKL